MDPDITIKIGIAVTIALAILGAVVGGLLTRAAGRWLDGDRSIELRQRGPLLSGYALRPGGWEEYSGFAIFGRVWINRRDGGPDHLAAMGFPKDTLQLIDGRVTAHLRLRLRHDQLEGTFVGLRFTFSGSPQRVVGEARSEPAPRIWVRDRDGATDDE